MDNKDQCEVCAQPDDEHTNGCPNLPEQAEPVELQPVEESIDPEEEQRRMQEAMNFHVDATRAGMFAAAMDMQQVMQENDVVNVAPIIMTGALEAAAQIWFQVSAAAGVPRQKSRKTFEKQARQLFTKHAKITDDAEAEAAKATEN